MVTVHGIKTLAMLKLEKNLIAVIEKGYARRPYDTYSINELADFIKREYYELDLELSQKSWNMLAVRNELADLSNTIDFLYEAIQGYE